MFNDPVLIGVELRAVGALVLLPIEVQRLSMNGDHRPAITLEPAHPALIALAMEGRILPLQLVVHWLQLHNHTLVGLEVLRRLGQVPRVDDVPVGGLLHQVLPQVDKGFGHGWGGKVHLQALPLELILLARLRALVAEEAWDDAGELVVRVVLYYLEFERVWWDL